MRPAPVYIADEAWTDLAVDPKAGRGAVEPSHARTVLQRRVERDRVDVGQEAGALVNLKAAGRRGRIVGIGNRVADGTSQTTRKRPAWSLLKRPSSTGPSGGSVPTTSTRQVNGKFQSGA